MRARWTTPLPVLALLLAGCTGYGRLGPDAAGPAGTTDDPSNGGADEARYTNRSENYQWQATVQECRPGMVCVEPSPVAETEYRPLGRLTWIDLQLRWTPLVPMTNPNLVFEAALQNGTGHTPVGSSEGGSPLALRVGFDANATANRSLVLRVRHTDDGMRSEQAFQVGGTLAILYREES